MQKNQKSQKNPKNFIEVTFNPILPGRELPPSLPGRIWLTTLTSFFSEMFKTSVNFVFWFSAWNAEQASFMNLAEKELMYLNPILHGGEVE